MNEFFKQAEAVNQQYLDGAITEREALAKIAMLVAEAYHKAPIVEGIDRE